MQVGAALSWTFDHAARLGGSPAQISLVGHSAGAHMCTLALMQRALAAAREADAAGGSAGENGGEVAAPGGDVRMPRRLVAIAGVYDIAKVRRGHGMLVSVGMS